MLSLMLRYRFGTARVLSITLAALSGAYFAVFHNWPWWAWFPVGVICLLFVPVLWGIFLGLLEMRRR